MKFGFEDELSREPGQRPSVTDAEAENLIREKAPEHLSTVIESLQANHGVEIAQAQEPAQELIQNLIRQLAAARIRADFEWIYAQIYGSQVAALWTLRETPNGAAREPVEAHLAQVKHNVNMRLVIWLQTLPFEAWFGYLQSNGLAEVGTDERYHLTIKGMGFLGYIDGLGYAPKSF
jgi:hypothetical protein